MLSEPRRPVSAPSGDWRREQHREHIRFDTPPHALPTLPRSKVAFHAVGAENGELHNNSVPGSNDYPVARPVQRSATIAVPERQDPAVPQAVPIPLGLDDPWERKTLLSLGQSYFERRGNPNN